MQAVHQSLSLRHRTISVRIPSLRVVRGVPRLGVQPVPVAVMETVEMGLEEAWKAAEGNNARRVVYSYPQVHQL